MSPTWAKDESRHAKNSKYSGVGMGLLLAMVIVAGVTLAGPASITCAQDQRRPIKKYNARYHVIYTDLPLEMVYEAIGRVNAMTQRYMQFASWLPGKLDRQLPFYFYSRYEDYQRSLGGRPQGSAGIYTGMELRATADKKRFDADGIWQAIQREGFHQFLHLAMAPQKTQFPLWLNEGLAEYFGEAVWTGNSLIAGVIDTRKGQSRLRRVQERIRAKEYKPFCEMIEISPAAWAAGISAANYDQVWSMTFFFIHGEGGKYRKAFIAYTNDIAAVEPNLAAFNRHFGGNPDAMQKEHDQWWLGLKNNPTADICDRITVDTLTGYLARGIELKGAKFPDIECFFAAAEKGLLDMDVKEARSLWLPKALLRNALCNAKKHPNWEIKIDAKKQPVLRLLREDGTVFEGRFELQDKNPPKVTVEIVPSTAGAGR